MSQISISIANLSKQGECLLNFDCALVVQSRCNWKDWHIVILNARIFTEKYEDFILTRKKRCSNQIFTVYFFEKHKDFYCYLLLAAENSLLAEQLQISASSSASKLPARANTTNKWYKRQNENETIAAHRLPCVTSPKKWSWLPWEYFAFG